MITQQGSQFTGPATNAYFGVSVALSSDGNSFITGAPGVAPTQQGGAYQYKRVAGSWSLVGSKLLGSGGTSLPFYFGSGWGTIGICGDGSVSFIGANGDRTYAGSAYVFRKDGSGVFVQEGSKLVGTGAAAYIYPAQGITTAISDDCLTVASAGPGDDTDKGAVWIFVYSGGSWSQQGSKLVGSGMTGAAAQGRGLSLSSDGNTVAIGGHQDASNTGAVWVWTRSGTTWTEQQQIKPAGYGANTYFGYGLALSNDGNTLVVGGYGADTNVGGAWIYVRSGGTWTAQGSKLVGSGATGAAQQGSSVCISNDGNFIVVGGMADNSGVGAGWAFTRVGTSWSQFGSRFVGTSNSGASAQGAGVACSGDKSTIALGGYADNTNTGAVWFFTTNAGPTAAPTKAPSKSPSKAPSKSPSKSPSKAPSKTPSKTPSKAPSKTPSKAPTPPPTRAPGITFSQSGSKLVGTGYDISVSSNVYQGVSLKLSADGTHLLESGSGDRNGLGSVWYFTRSGSTWTQQQRITPTPSSTPSFGNIAMTPDAATAAFGCASADTVYVFTRSGTTWTQQGSGLTPSDGISAPYNFGSSLGLSSDGNTLAIGGFADNGNIGAMWIFTRSGSTWTQQQKIIPSDYVGSSIVMGISGTISYDGHTVAFGGYGDSTNIGAVWVWTRASFGGTYTQQAKLTPTGSSGTPIYLGNALIGISSDGNTLSAGGQNDNTGGTGYGAIWVWVRSGASWSQQGSKLVPTGGSNPSVMRSQLSADGNIMVVSGQGDSSNVGAFWVYIRTGTSWAQSGSKLTGSGYSGTFPNQGAITISGDGSIVAIGGFTDTSVNAGFMGAVWIFVGA